MSALGQKRTLRCFNRSRPSGYQRAGHQTKRIRSNLRPLPGQWLSPDLTLSRKTVAAITTTKAVTTNGNTGALDRRVNKEKRASCGANDQRDKHTDQSAVVFAGQGLIIGPIADHEDDCSGGSGRKYASDV
jgi:hypothetical protein